MDEGINDADSVHPFKLFKNQEYKNNNKGRLDLCVEYVQLLSSRDKCKNHTNSKKKLMRCNCLGFINNNVYWEATGNWMVDFGSMKKDAQQRVVIEKIRQADSLSETLDAADPKKHFVYCLPFIMTEADDAVEDSGAIVQDGTRAIVIEALQKHKICKSALMELMSVGKDWWRTCRNHLNRGTVPVHGLKNKPSNRKRKFRDEEEAYLIEFFVDIKEFAEPSATGEKSTHNDDTELEYLPTSWSRLKLYQRYACTRGWDAATDNIGSTVLAPRAGEVQLRLCSWPSFFYYWKTNYPKLRVSKPIEDIYIMSYIFQNTHKYAKRKQLPALSDSEHQTTTTMRMPLFLYLSIDLGVSTRVSMMMSTTWMARVSMMMSTAWMRRM
jgi:hypothetical protein